MIKDVFTEADRLVAAGRVDDAVALVDRAGTAGDRNAMYRLAQWKLAGDVLPRDVPGARALLQRATAAGSEEAALTEIALRGNGSGAPADWAGARALMDTVAATSRIAAGQNALLNEMRLTTDGAPITIPHPHRIGERPDVLHYPKLFTSAECLHIAQCAADVLQPATVVDPRTGHNVANPIRTSDGAVIGPTRETLVVQALNRRLASITRSDIRQGEALAVLRYRPNQQFHPHLDAIGGARNQRVKTVLVYLNEGFKGGATVFPHNGLSVTPQTGDAIVFDNTLPDGSIDRTTLHAGEPVTAGVKWLATRWIRARPFSVWSGPESV